MRWLLLVQLVCVAVVAAAVATVVRAQAEPAQPVPATATVPVTRAVAACPQLPAHESTDATVFAVGPKITDAEHDSSLAVRRSGAPDATVLAESADPGTVIRKKLPESEDAAAWVRATGDAAAGLTALQRATYDRKDVRGVAATWCRQPAEDWWFNGVTTKVGTQARLVLSNPASSIAVLDLTFLGPDGRVDAPGSRGIAIAPHGRKVLDLTSYAPGEDGLTVHASAVKGQVVAALRTAHVTGVTADGVEWVPPASPPSTTYPVTAVPAVEGAQTLMLTNPGERQAVVQVRAVTEDGTFTPTSLTDVQVPPHTVVSKDIGPVTKGDVTGLVVTAGEPVAAAVVSKREKKPVDYTVASGAPAVTTPFVVPVAKDWDQSLAFTNTADTPAKLRIRSYDDQGNLGTERTVDLAPQRVTAWVMQPAKDTSYLTVSVLSGDQVRGAMEYSTDVGLTSLPVRSAPWTVTRPAVVPAP